MSFWSVSVKVGIVGAAYATATFGRADKLSPANDRGRNNLDTDTGKIFICDLCGLLYFKQRLPVDTKQSIQCDQ